MSVTTTLDIDEAQRDLAEIMRRDLPFEEKAERALDLGTRFLRVENAYLTRIDEETDHWKAVASTDSADGRFPPGLELDLGTTYYRRTIKSESSTALSNVPEQGWKDDPAVEKHGLHCYHRTALTLNDEPYGTICFVSEDPRDEPFTDAETMFAELIARMLEQELLHDQHEAQLTRQSNLSAVLNRVLRHNLKNNISVIRGYTQLMSEELGNPSYGTTSLANIDKLLDLSEKVRELDQIVNTSFERESTDITALIENLAQMTSDNYPDATITVEYDEDLTARVLPSFERALRELIENAAKHSGDNPTVTIEVAAVPNAVEIRIVDDGPGVDDEEAKVLESGAETPLVHGSGIGLWLAHCIVTSHGGSIQAAATDEGTTMTVSVPRKPIADAQDDLTRLAQARDQYQAVFESARDAMVIVNDDARIIDANAKASQVYGMDEQDLLGQSLRRFFPDDFDFEAFWMASHEEGTDLSTMRLVGAGGVERTVEYSVANEIVPGQTVIVSRDVTERVEREAELRSKTRAMDKAPVGITLSDPSKDDNPFVYANERFRELTGYGDSAIGQNCRYLQGEETDQAVVARIRQAIDAEEGVRETLRNYRKDGTSFWNRLTIAPVRDETGTLTRWVGFQEDMTDRVEREKELKETTQRLEAMIKASPDAIVALDTNGTIQLWNEAAEDVFGYDADTVVGEQIQSLGFHSDDQQDEFERQFRRALEGKTLSDHEIQRQTKDGDRIQLHLSTAPIRDESGKITGVVGVAS